MTVRYNRQVYRKWYLKLKSDPLRWAAYLQKGRAWNTTYRRRRSQKYLHMLSRKRSRRSLNPFALREKARAYYADVKADPLAYAAMLKKKRIAYAEKMNALRSDAERYRSWRHERMVYHRYYRIRQAVAV